MICFTVHSPGKGAVMHSRWGMIPVIILICTLGVCVSVAHCKSRPHRDVWLKNEQGQIITAKDNATDPYSPRQTCGRCHPYSTITSGFHFQQGFDEMSDTFDPKKSWIYSPGMFGKW